MMRLALWRFTGSPGVVPAAFERMNEAVTLPSGRVHIRRWVAGFSDENCVFRIADDCSRYLERRQFVRCALPLAVVPAQLARPVMAEAVEELG